MLLSELFKNSRIDIKYELVGEVEFKTLALAGAGISQSFCTFVENEKYINGISDYATMVITKETVAKKLIEMGKGVCIVDNPRITFFMLHNQLYSNPQYVSESKETTIGKNCKISNFAHIADKNVVIGNNVTIEEFVSIKENVTIGDNVVLRAGTIIGGEGFEFKNVDSGIMPVKHLGHVEICNNAELQQSVCVDRAVYPWDCTVIGEHTKIDNLVHVAHGVKIGSRCMVVANSGIGGRVEIGDDCWIGLGTTIRNGLIIGEKARVNMGAVVTKDVPAGAHVSGNFAIEHSKFIQHMKSISK